MWAENDCVFLHSAIVYYWKTITSPIGSHVPPPPLSADDNINDNSEGVMRKSDETGEAYEILFSIILRTLNNMLNGDIFKVIKYTLL